VYTEEGKEEEEEIFYPQVPQTNISRDFPKLDTRECTRIHENALVKFVNMSQLQIGENTLRLSLPKCPQKSRWRDPNAKYRPTTDALIFQLVCKIIIIIIIIIIYFRPHRINEK